MPVHPVALRNKKGNKKRASRRYITPSVVRLFEVSNILDCGDYLLY